MSLEGGQPTDRAVSFNDFIGAGEERGRASVAMSRRDDDLPINVDAQEIIGTPEAAVHAAVSLELLPRQ